MSINQEQENPFRFLDLPQELQDNIVKAYYSPQTTVTVKYEGPHYSPRYLGKRKPPVFQIEGEHDNLLLVSKHVATTARNIKSKTDIKLVVQHHENKDLAALKDICSYAQAARYSPLRARVTHIFIDCLDRQSSAARVNGTFDLTIPHFPKLDTITLRYECTRQVYESYSDYSETDEWRKVDTFKEGSMDVDMRFPASRLKLYDLAEKLQKMGKDEVEIVLRSVVHWNAKGRGHYGSLYIDYLVNPHDTKVVKRAFGLGL